MFCAVRQYKDCSDVPQLITQVNDELLPAIRDMAGYHSYTVLHCGDGDVISISMFDTKEHAEHANDEVTKMVAQSLSRFINAPPIRSIGEVVIENHR